MAELVDASDLRNLSAMARNPIVEVERNLQSTKKSNKVFVCCKLNNLYCSLIALIRWKSFRKKVKSMNLKPVTLSLNIYKRERLNVQPSFEMIKATDHWVIP